MRKIKRHQFLLCITSLLLVFTMTFSEAVMLVKADSNDRGANLIALGADKATESSSGTTEFTYEELRVIGIFLSNYYIPMGTQINNTGDSEADAQTKENMITALTTSLNFDEGVATTLVDQIYAMSLSTAEPLYVDASYTYETNETQSVTGKNCSWATMLTLMSAGDITLNSPANFYWKDDSNVHHIVFSRSGTAGLDACEYVFRSIISDMNTVNGYGTGLMGTGSDMDTANSSSSITGDEIGSYMNSFGGDNASIYKASAFGWQMYVDCFGNIIADNGVGRAFIVVPACINPYTFAKDTVANLDTGTEGLAVPLNSLYFMFKSSQETLTTSTASLSKDYINGLSGGSGLSILNWTTMRGSSVTNIANETWYGTADDVTKEYLSGIAKINAGYDNIASEYSVMPEYYGFSIDSSDFTSLPIIHSQVDPDFESNTIYTIQDFIFFNTLADFTSTNIDTMATSEYGIFDSEGKPLVESGAYQFSSDVDENNDFNLSVTGEASRCFVGGIYTSYVFAYLRSDGIMFGENNDVVAYKLNIDGLPETGDGSCSLSGAISSDSLDTTLKSYLYYLLHPTEGSDYVRQLFSKFVNSSLIETHDGIVGNTSTTNSTGGNKYLNFSGYVTTPNLTDIGWIDSALSQYSVLVIYLLIFMLVVTFGTIITGNVSVQRGIVSFAIFGALVLVPPKAIDATITVANKVCDAIYTNKFNYWALVQHESYVDSINSALAEGESGESDFLVSQFRQNAYYQSDTTSVVALKWLSPKKNNYMVDISEDMNAVGGTSASNLLAPVYSTIRSNTSGESYLEGNYNLYLYRSYTDLGTYANVPYRYIAGTKNGSYTTNVLSQEVEVADGLTVYEALDNYRYDGASGSSLSYATMNGFNYQTNINNHRMLSILYSREVDDAILTPLSELNLSLTAKGGIQQQFFNTTILDMNSDEVPTSLSRTYADYYSTFMFGEYTESPFYYFSFNLNDQMTTTSGGNSAITYKDMLLSTSNEYFYNTSSALNDTQGYGELRDFTDMRSLFYCVIPYMKQANNKVVEFDNEYGLYMYDGVSVDFNSDYTLNTATAPQDKNSAEYYKWWHNVIASQMFNLYCPWIDKMYDCDYAESETIKVAGNNFIVSDPLNPYTYYEEDLVGNLVAGRYMIFSESEMEYYGLTVDDLTQVEQKIINVQSNTYEDLLEIMDYYSFDNEVINTAIAMIETFNFNKEFSQESVIGESYVLYPQGYELKNFTYDAYLRLILINSFGSDLQLASDSGESVNLYSQILESTSLITGVLMIALDVIAMYVIPAMKLIFLVLIFVMSIAVIMTSVFGTTPNYLGVFINSLAKPLIKFLLVSVGMAFIVSLFMSDGNTAVTGRTSNTVSLGDPTLTIILMLVINIVAVVLYILILKSTFKDVKKTLKQLGSFAIGALTGAVTAMVGAVSKGKTAVSSVGHGATTIGNAVSRGAKNITGTATATVKTVDKARKWNNNLAYENNERNLYNQEKKAEKMALKADKLESKAEKRADLHSQKLEDAKRVQKDLKENSGYSMGDPFYEKKVRDADKAVSKLEKQSTKIANKGLEEINKAEKLRDKSGKANTKSNVYRGKSAYLSSRRGVQHSSVVRTDNSPKPVNKIKNDKKQ